MQIRPPFFLLPSALAAGEKGRRGSALDSPVQKYFFSLTFSGPSLRNPPSLLLLLPWLGRLTWLGGAAAGEARGEEEAESL